MNSVNEEYYNQAVDYIGDAENNINDAVTVASSISIPSDFSDSAVIEDAITGVKTDLKSLMDNYSTTFLGLSSVVQRLIELEKNAKAEAENLDCPKLINDFSGNAVALLTSEGIVNLLLFKAKTTDKGTYFSWTGGKDSNIKTPCDIFIPNVKKINGVMIYLPNDNAYKNLKAGEITTSSIVMIPAEYYFEKKSNHMYYPLSKAKSQQLVQDAQNIANTFGVDSKDISIYGFSAMGRVAAEIVESADPGTFKSVVFSSTKYGVENLSDPNVKVITIVGEHDGSNGVEAMAAVQTFKDEHLNEVEVFTVGSTEEIPVVSHLLVTEAALKSEEFNGMNIFDYALSDESSITANLSSKDEIDILDVSLKG